eukprot:5118765-Ditylum_brightwellii.AAC.1
MEQLQSCLQLLQQKQEELSEAQRLLNDNVVSLCCHLEPWGFHLLPMFCHQRLLEPVLDPTLYRLVQQHCQPE